MHWARQCAVPNELPDVGLGDSPKGVSPGLSRGMHAFFVLFLVNNVGGNVLHGYKSGGNVV